MAKKQKTTRDIALDFQRKMQKLADKGGLTISMSVGDGGYKTIAEPKKPKKP